MSADPRLTRETHIREQAAAAAQEVDERLNAIARAHGQPSAIYRDTPPWVPTELHAGCSHVGDEPMPVMASLKDPSVIRCPDCAHQAEAEDLVADPDLCDLCREPSRGQRFRTVMGYSGAVMFYGNICPTCHQRRWLPKGYAAS